MPELREAMSDEKRQAAGEQTPKRDDVTDFAEEAARKTMAATSKEARVSSCECPPGCVGLPCCT